MNRTDKNVLESLISAKQHILDQPITPANLQVTALTTQLDGVITVMTEHRNSQDLGLGAFADGSASKAETAAEVRRPMKRISKIGKELDSHLFPNVRLSLRMPRSGYQQLQARAETFVTTVTPIKTAFVDRGLPADFDVQLEAALAAFQAAVQRQSSGRAKRVQGTTGLSVARREGRKIVRAIDSILFALYADSPALYAAWKSASRVQALPASVSALVLPPAAPAS